MASYPNVCGAGTDMKVDGNSGFGVATPAKKVEVNGEVLVRGTGGWTSNQSAIINMGDTVSFVKNVWGGSMVVSSNNALQIETSALNKNITIMPNGTGKVGIGVASPNQKLEVGGAITISNANGTPADGTIWFDGTDFRVRVMGVTKKISLV